MLRFFASLGVGAIVPPARVTGRPFALVAGVVLAAAIAGCTFGSSSPAAPMTHGPTAAPGGLTSAAATTRALQLARASSASVVVWASIETNPFTSSAVSAPGGLVWIVRIKNGLGASPCPSGFIDRVPTPSDTACLDGEGGVNVVLDYFDGNLLGWIH